MTADPLTDRLAADLDEAFPDVVREVTDGLFTGAYRMLGDRQEAEDVTQEALIRAYRALAGYPAERIRELRLRPWVWTIAANLCRNRLRSRGRRPSVPLVDHDPPDGAPGPDDHAEAVELQGDLARLVADLPWAMRAAVVLHHVVGMPYDEISIALDRPATTIRSDAHRGLARLRAALPEEYA